MFTKSFTTFFVSLVVVLSWAACVSARITGISGDGHFAKQGFSYPITFTTQDTSTDNLDFTVVLGWSSSPVPSGGVGSIAFSTVDLLSIGETNTGTGSFTVQVPLDPTVFQLTQNTVFTLTAAVTSLTGAAKIAVVSLFSTSITIEP
ncbi:hypothetical protein SISNIDRAFT_487381 [Sistotremastrum niveocremeum HHB9708]|uniref:Uncharacterized protein n=2 Tax=Sistotremastraceae TaxID=3402574 RepID=A0A164SEB3_9AGAM|nr:hypothetical protein SISNIDRAFT_487381 [Sistotremastrum niveocremeum HHB9708]KZT33831.1 hypothetical protein SISSUDRAFT_1065830 [Sistotremastrum suecicum HHB10207 ss-3]